MTSEYLLIGNEQERRRMPYNSILYITTEDYLSTFILDKQPKFICSKPLSEIKTFLPHYFFQINRSCIINLTEVESIKRNSKQLILSDKSEHTISIRRIKALRIALADQNTTITR